MGSWLVLSPTFESGVNESLVLVRPFQQLGLEIKGRPLAKTMFRPTTAAARNDQAGL